MKKYTMNRKSILVWVLLVGSICAASAQTIIRPKISCPNGVYVNSYNGVLFYQRTDLQIPNRGLNLEAIFYYNSSANRTNYGYGNGWSIGMEMRYIPDSAGIIIEQVTDDRTCTPALVICLRHPLGFSTRCRRWVTVTS